MLADKGYPSRANRARLRERGLTSTIPERDDRLEAWHPMAMRTGTTARSYDAAITLAATLIWITTDGVSTT